MRSQAKRRESDTCYPRFGCSCARVPECSPGRALPPCRRSRGGGWTARRPAAPTPDQEHDRPQRHASDPDQCPAPPRQPTTRGLILGRRRRGGHLHAGRAVRHRRGGRGRRRGAVSVTVSVVAGSLIVRVWVVVASVAVVSLVSRLRWPRRLRPRRSRRRGPAQPRAAERDGRVAVPQGDSRRCRAATQRCGHDSR